jgi:hypothetical protein
MVLIERAENGVGRRRSTTATAAAAAVLTLNDRTGRHRNLNETNWSSTGWMKRKNRKGA